MEFTSRFSLGEIVLFQPDINKIDRKKGKIKDMTGAIYAKIMAVTFTPGHILYDLALNNNSIESFDHKTPLKHVDSFYICDID